MAEFVHNNAFITTSNRLWEDWRKLAEKEVRRNFAVANKDELGGKFKLTATTEQEMAQSRITLLKSEAARWALIRVQEAQARTQGTQSDQSPTWHAKYAIVCAKLRKVELDGLLEVGSQIATDIRKHSSETTCETSNSMSQWSEYLKHLTRLQVKQEPKESRQDWLQTIN